MHEHFECLLGVIFGWPVTTGINQVTVSDTLCIYIILQMLMCIQAVAFINLNACLNTSFTTALQAGILKKSGIHHNIGCHQFSSLAAQRMTAAFTTILMRHRSLIRRLQFISFP